MWQLVKSELIYHRLLLAVCIVVAMPVAAAYTTLMDETEIGLAVGFLPLIAAWALTGSVFESRNRERRERMLALLPLATHQVALSRLVVAVLPFGLALAVYAAVRQIILPESHSAAVLQIGVGFCLTVYGVTFALQDLFSTVARRKLKGGLAAALGLLLAAGLGAFAAVRPGQPHPILRSVVVAPVEFLQSPQGPTRFVLVSLVIGFLTVLTYSRRKSYLQT